MYRVTTQPASEPLSTPEAKLHLKVEHTADDTLIAAIITAAREGVENYIGRGLITQTITQVFDSFPLGGDPMKLSIGQLQSVTSITYTDDAGANQTVDPSVYVVHTYNDPPLISLASGQSWPSPKQQAQVVRVVYVVGYGAASSVPVAIKQSMLLAIAHWYENRADSVRRLPTQAQHLLNPYRVWTQ